VTSGRQAQRYAHSRGYTLLELTVASTLASVFAILIGSASSMFFGLMDDLQVRTENLRNANVIRASMIGDARRAESSVCPDGNSLLFTFDGGTQVEYTASGGNLLAWQSVRDRHVALANRVMSFACADHGSEGLELVVSLGDEQRRSHVYMHIAQAEEEEGGEE
jgi:hypothetical protein